MSHPFKTPFDEADPQDPWTPGMMPETAAAIREEDEADMADCDEDEDDEDDEP